MHFKSSQQTVNEQATVPQDPLIICRGIFQHLSICNASAILQRLPPSHNARHELLLTTGRNLVVISNGPQDSLHKRAREKVLQHIKWCTNSMQQYRGRADVHADFTWKGHGLKEEQDGYSEGGAYYPSRDGLHSATSAAHPDQF